MNEFKDFKIVCDLIREKQKRARRAYEQALAEGEKDPCPQPDNLAAVAKAAFEAKGKVKLCDSLLKTLSGVAAWKRAEQRLEEHEREEILPPY